MKRCTSLRGTKQSIPLFWIASGCRLRNDAQHIVSNTVAKIQNVIIINEQLKDARHCEERSMPQKNILY